MRTGNATYQVRYREYAEGVFTVPVKLTPERIVNLNDYSIAEIKISIKP